MIPAVLVGLGSRRGERYGDGSYTRAAGGTGYRFVPDLAEFIHSTLLPGLLVWNLLDELYPLSRGVPNWREYHISEGEGITQTLVWAW